jgi:hypothetical protein
MAGRCYAFREVGCVESAVRISSVYSMFGWTANLALLAGADYCHLANFTCSVLDHIRYTAYRK